MRGIIGFPLKKCNLCRTKNVKTMNGLDLGRLCRRLRAYIYRGVLCALPLFAAASPSRAGDVRTADAASAELYDFSPFSAETVLELFAKAQDAGRTVPTEAEFEAAGILPVDLAFVRSHVAKAEICPRATDHLVPDIYPERELWLNFPCASEEENRGGYPNDDFDTDAFSMWQYTNLFGSWNHCFFQAPGAWVDAAHRNGTDILSGLKFFESWNVGDADWVAFCTKRNADGEFRYVKPLINALLFFGHDGINFNWEDEHYKDDDVVAFHKALYKEAARVGFDNFHVAMYTSNMALTPSEADALFGSTAKGKTADLMLNYADGDFSPEMAASAYVAEKLTGSPSGVYAGVHILSMDRSWDMLNADESMQRCGLCLWGEHGSTWFWANNEGASALERQDNYQKLLERGFSGGKRNPASRPEPSSTGNNWHTDAAGNAPLATFCGLAEFVAERSAIHGDLPFATHFNLGNGAAYAYKGKRAAGRWTNMGAQDVVPTYRWLTLRAGTDEPDDAVQCELSHRDAYTGGSCLHLSGEAGGTDVVLFKTALRVAGGTPAAKLAVKAGGGNGEGTRLSLLLRRKGSQSWDEYPAGTVQGGAWEEKSLTLDALAQGDSIDRIALRVTGGGACDLYVGMLQIEDGTRRSVAEVKDLRAEVRQETLTSLSVKLCWQTGAADGARAGWQMVTNGEADIHHFEVLCKNGADGRVREVGRTSQWAALVPRMQCAAGETPYIGVRAVSTDLHTCSPVEWIAIPRSAAVELSADTAAADIALPLMDAGEPDEPEGLDGSRDGIAAAPAAATLPRAEAAGAGEAVLSNTTRAWAYTPDGRLAASVRPGGAAVFRWQLPASGTYVLRLENGSVTRTVRLAL